MDSDPECNDLLPDHAPATVAITRTPPDGHSCAGGLSDGTGSVAVEATGSGGSSFQVFGADGTPRNVFEAASPLVSEVRGWHAIRAERFDATGFPAIVSHLSIAPDGTVERVDQVSRPSTGYLHHRWSLAADPLGGSLVAITSVTLTGNHWYAVDAHRFDDAGAPRFSPPLVGYGETQPILVLGGVSRGGEALVAWPTSAQMNLVWAGADGAVHESGAEDLALLGPTRSSGVLALAPLLDGGLALAAGGRWVRRYEPRSMVSTAPPGWLAARDGWTYRFTRGNAGYALLPPPGRDSPDCSQAIELLAPSGRLCGRVVLHGDGAACSTGAVDQGWDGTVVQQSAAGACTYRFWPRLLAKG